VKVVFDSNIYVSALAIPGGVAEQALRLAMEGRVELATSRPVLAEVLEVLARKFARDPEHLARTALFLSSLAEMVAPAKRLRILADDPDNRILECAIAARADAIVTGDRQVLALGVWEGIRILSLRDFVDSQGSPSEVRQSRAPYGSPSRGAIRSSRRRGSATASARGGTSAIAMRR